MARAGQGPGYIAIDFACTSPWTIFLYIMKGDWDKVSMYIQPPLPHTQNLIYWLTLKILLHSSRTLYPSLPFPIPHPHLQLHLCGVPSPPVPINITPAQPSSDLLHEGFPDSVCGKLISPFLTSVFCTSLYSGSLFHILFLFIQINPYWS